MNNHFGPGVDKMREVPSLHELATQRLDEQERLEKLTVEQRETERNERIDGKVQQRGAEGVPSSVELRRRPVVDQAALTSSS